MTVEEIFASEGEQHHRVKFVGAFVIDEVTVVVYEAFSEPVASIKSMHNVLHTRRVAVAAENQILTSIITTSGWTYEWKD